MNHLRHQNIFQIPSGFSVTLIGAGGIGAIASLTLAKMGVRSIVIFDPDVVSEENLATQWHKISDLGHQKVAALCNALLEYSDDIAPSAYAEPVDANTVLRSSLVISAVDSISARQAIWQAILRPESSWSYYLDMRMSSQEYQHFLVPESDEAAIAAYHRKLMSLSEEDVEELPCTMKATFFCAMAAGHAGTVLADIVTGKAEAHRLVHAIRPEIIYRLPV